MKKPIVLIGLLALALALSGCTQPEPVTTYQFVCSDGSVVSAVSQCQAGTEPDLDALCADYCETGPDPIPEYTEQYITGQINEANYCDTNNDCALAIRKCPFGCYILVNKSELDRINGLIDGHLQRCVLTCAKLDEFTCFEGKCKPVIFGDIWDSY